MSYTNEILKLFNSDVTSYRIAADLTEMGYKTSTQFIDNYRIAGRKVGNMQLEKAEMLMDYIKTQKEEIEMAATVESITTYLEGYEQTYSNAMDSTFGLFKSDVYSLAKDLAKGELYIYSKEDYVDYLEGVLKENVEYHVSNGMTEEEALEEENELVDNLEEIKESTSTVFIESSNSDSYYAV